MAQAKYVFMDDRIVPWDEARVHVASVGFKFGTAVFEGLRGYWNERDEQMYLLLLEPHMRRLEVSQKFMRFDSPYSGDYVAEKTIELIRANEFREGVHIMTTTYVSGFGPPGTTGPVGLSITAAPRPHRDVAEHGVTAQVSSWQRLPDAAMPIRIKCNANYNNGRLAQLQAKADGYDTAILLNTRGKVSEGPAMCFFMIRNGRAVTPGVTSDLLESITRNALVGLLGEYCELEVDEREIDRSELVSADEAFFCGTAWEVTPITSIDRLPVGKGVPGPITRRLQEVYEGIASGRMSDHPEWRTPVYGN